MNRGTMTGVSGVLAAGLLLAGCSTPAAHPRQTAAVEEVAQGMLGDLNRYMHALLRQRSSGNAEAEKVLVRLLAGKGLPVSEAAAAGR